MFPSRRHLAVLALALSCGWAAAQSTKPIKLLVGFPPGGGTDVVARTWAGHVVQRVSDLGQNLGRGLGDRWIMANGFEPQ